MMNMLRIVLLAVIALLMIGTVIIGVGSTNTGLVEKAVLLAFGLLLVFASIRVRRIGRGAA